MIGQREILLNVVELMEKYKIPYLLTGSFAVSAEDLILTKLAWYREIRSDRHLRDCVGIIKTQQAELDWEYLNLWAKKLGVTEFLAEVKESDYSSY